MAHTLALQTISDAWMEALKNSDKIKDFCNSHYGRSPVLINGGNPREHRTAIIVRISS